MSRLYESLGSRIENTAGTESPPGGLRDLFTEALQYFPEYPAPLYLLTVPEASRHVPFAIGSVFTIAEPWDHWRNGCYRIVAVCADGFECVREAEEDTP